MYYKKWKEFLFDIILILVTYVSSKSGIIDQNMLSKIQFNITVIQIQKSNYYTSYYYS